MAAGDIITSGALSVVPQLALSVVLRLALSVVLRLDRRTHGFAYGQNRGEAVTRRFFTGALIS
jgi:hypothetical protein